jgi:hypothetical protein
MAATNLERHAEVMLTTATINHATAQLLGAARSLADASGRESVASLPDELDALAGALRVAADACGKAATRVVPAGAIDDSICDRYERARATWPVVPSPTNERLAALLSGLHDTVGAVRHAADRCDQASHAVGTALALGDRVPPAA